MTYNPNQARDPGGKDGGRFIPKGTTGVDEGTAEERAIAANIEVMRLESLKYNSASEFADALTADHLTDLSNRELHRLGRAVPLSPQDEPYVDLQTAISEGRQDEVGVGEWARGDPSLKPEFDALFGEGDTVTIYRGVPTTANYIEIGDFVTLDPEYASASGDLNNDSFKVLKMEVPKSDVVWGGADAKEWAYSPKAFRDQVGDLETFWKNARSQSLPDGRKITVNSPGVGRVYERPKR